MITSCSTLITDTRGIFSDAIRKIASTGDIQLAMEVELLADQFYRMEQALDDLAEEDRLKEQAIVARLKGERDTLRGKAKVVCLKPALTLIQGGKA